MEASCKKQLSIAAARIRMDVIEGTFHAKSGHPGGSLSIADTLAYLYFKEMKVDPANPKWEARDRFVLSKGHAAPALYGALAQKGYFPEAEIQSLRHVGAILQGHPDMKGIPGVDMSTGSLGQGVSCAAGMALAAKLDKADWRVYTRKRPRPLRRRWMLAWSLSSKLWRFRPFRTISPSFSRIISFMGISPFK